MSAREIIDIYISFFEKRGHNRILNSPLVPENDPTTLFTSSGMQPLISYLLGEPHPSGNRLVDVQNCFRAVDIEEVGDNRHTTFFRMLGNWSLGDYFKSEEIPWLWEFLTKELRLPKEKLYVAVFAGDENVEFDSQSEQIWRKIFEQEKMEPKIYKGDVTKNWWSRSGTPDKMPVGEPGGPDTEVYFKFDDIQHNQNCDGDDPTKCECGKFLEIANSVFMEYLKTEDGFKELPNKNVDFGGGLERLLAAVENQSDIFQTSLFAPIIEAIEKTTGKSYKENKQFRVIADHLRASVYLLDAKVIPSNKERGYILRRLIRRAIDNLGETDGTKLEQIIEAIVNECSKTDESLSSNFEFIKNSILEENQKYEKARLQGIRYIEKKYGGKVQIFETPMPMGNELKGTTEISSEDAFNLYTSYGLSPTQIKSMGYTFNEQEFADLMEKHKNLSKTSSGMFKGGLADTQELTIKGHTATHLLHQALRDIFGEKLHQSGSNITSERVRFDFNHDKMLSEGELKKVEKIVREKIQKNLPVHFEIMPLSKAKELGAIGLFDEKYQTHVKVYFIGDYSKELCGGPHVDFTGSIKSFRIIKQENLGKGYKRIYAKVE